MPVGTYQVQSPGFLKIVYYQDHAIHLTHQTEFKKEGSDYIVAYQDSQRKSKFRPPKRSLIYMYTVQTTVSFKMRVQVGV